MKVGRPQIAELETKLQLRYIYADHDGGQSRMWFRGRGLLQQLPAPPCSWFPCQGLDLVLLDVTPDVPATLHHRGIPEGPVEGRFPPFYSPTRREAAPPISYSALRRPVNVGACDSVGHVHLRLMRFLMASCTPYVKPIPR